MSRHGFRLARPGVLHTIVVALTAVVALVAAAPAGAQHLFEPEIGLKAFDGKINDLIEPGPFIGATYGRVAARAVAIVLHADLGFHGTRIRGDYGGNPGGRSFDTALGVMFSPSLRDPDRSIAPYASALAGGSRAGIGGSGMTWAMGLEGGVSLRGGAPKGLSLGLRWMRRTSGDELVFAGRWLFRLPA